VRESARASSPRILELKTPEELPMPVQTAKVEGRRKLAYKSLEELLADADQVSSGPVTTLGNWSAGQIFRHLAIAFNGSIDGFDATFPWYLRFVAGMFKHKLINSPMPPGVKLPAAFAREVVPEPTSTEDGLAQLHAAVARLKQEPERAKHPVFGNFSKEEWDKIHLNHANLHMSFLIPQ
jgi:Protein of unknown function (DUF1569)